MKFTLSWLKEYLDTDATLEEICNCLTNIGLEVEEIIDRGAGLEQFEVALVTKTNKHPDADKLNICQVTTAKGEISLICGAANVRAGLKVAYAPIGSIIPQNGMQIKKAKIRGIESSGMLCSAKELGLGNDHEGIMELDDKAEIGCKINQALQLNDPIIEIAITPNRGDAASVYGIARDLAAAGLGTLKTLTEPEKKSSFETTIKLKSETPEIRQFYLVEIRNLKNQPSPNWLKERLEAIGVTTHSAIVDVTNYICHAFGQPLHAYAKDKISGRFILRKAKQDEIFTSLEDKEYKLQPEDLVIADEEKINGLAGIIGGKTSSTQLEDSTIYLEAAEFDEVAISKTGRKHQILSDARFRFEREIDHSKTCFFLRYAANLIQEICQGEISEVIGFDLKQKQATNISFPFDKISKCLGIQLSEEQVTRILQNLSCQDISISNGQVKLIAPLYRNDLKQGHDIIEEIARLHGFNNIQEQEFPQQKLNEEEQKNSYNYNILLASLGLDETINYSFINESEALNFTAKDELLEVSNPISIDLKFMRPSLIPSLLKNLQARQNRSVNSVSLFEKGTIFKKIDNDASETQAIATLRCGPRTSKQVNNDSSFFDIYDVKNDLYAILTEAGLPAERVQVKTTDLPSFMHPGRSAKLYLGKNFLGYFGELHPKLATNLNLKHRVNFCEIFISNLPKTREKKISAYIPNSIQPLNRDFAFIVDEKVKAADIKNEIIRLSKSLVKQVYIFDEYKGDKLPKDKKSLAFNLLLQPQKQDLTNSELEEFNKIIIDNITQKFNASLP